MPIKFAHPLPHLSETLHIVLKLPPIYLTFPLDLSPECTLSMTTLDLFSRRHYE